MKTVCLQMPNVKQKVKLVGTLMNVVPNGAQEVWGNGVNELIFDHWKRNLVILDAGTYGRRICEKFDVNRTIKSVRGRSGSLALR